MKKDFFISLNEILQNKEPVLLATIIYQRGSSPRGTGARMAVLPSGVQIGTIGGGRLEATIHERITELLHSGISMVQDFILSEAEAANLEMICGGSISILVDPIDPGNEPLKQLYQQVAQIIGQHGKGWILSLIPDGESNTPAKKSLITSDGKVNGSWLPEVAMKENDLEMVKISGQEISLSNLDIKSPQMIAVENLKLFLEPIGEQSTVLIVGAGHVAQMIAPLTTLVGFETIVLDDRVDFISQDRFPGVDRRILLDNFEGVFENVKVDSSTYIVIVTRGHQFDKSVLHQALLTPATYIGMIGSRRKIKLTFESLAKEGISEGKLAEVNSPIGLKIGAETPEEIAISIVAELIEIRSQGGKRLLSRD